MDPSGVETPGLPVALLDKGGAPFQVRQFRPEDRAALEAFYDRFEPKRAAQGLPPIGPERIARWLDAILLPGIHLLVERDETLIGHAFLIPTDRPATAEYAIFLSQESRGQGIGTQTNRVAVEVARRTGLRRLWLSLEPHNRPALRSYEKVGFRFLPGTVYFMEAEMEMEL